MAGAPGGRAPRTDVAEVVGDRVRIRVVVQPRAARPGIVGRHGDALKVRVSAPPEDGRANDEVCRVLADGLGVPRRSVTITAGHASRAKTVDVACADAAAAGSVSARADAL